MPESQHLEYKRELNDALEKEVVAFLNHRDGGQIHIGVDDEGVLKGLKDPDGDQLKIKDRLKQNIQPSCLGLFDIVLESSGDKDWIRLIVASGSEKPYYLRKLGMSPRGCFIRIGSAAEPMPERQIEQLFATRIRNSIGRIAAPRQDLRFNQLKIYYEGSGRPLGEQFASNLELLTETGAYNYAAYLLADVNNKELMRVFRDLDMVEHLGSGVPRILKAYPKSCFRFTDNFIRMAFPSSEKTSVKSAVKSAVKSRVKSVVKTPDQILEVLRDHPDYTLQEVATHINKSLSLVEKTAAKLRKAGKLEYVGPQKGGHWKVLKP